MTKARKKATAIAEEVAAQDLVLRDGEGRELRYAEAAEFVTEALRQIAALDTVESVYAFWSRNAATFGKLRVRPGDGAASARRLADALKGRAREIGVPQPSSEPEADTRVSAGEQNGSYLIPKEKRIRDKDHLAFVASQPCLVCGRKPAQAHHVRFAQPHGLGIKVSDEFTVPLCNTHHDQLHRSGNERRFWAQNAVPDPLKSAARLWEASRGHRRSVVANGGMKFDPDMEAEFSEPYLAPPKAPSQVAKPAVVSSAGSSDSNPCAASVEGLARSQKRPA